MKGLTNSTCHVKHAALHKVCTSSIHTLSAFAVNRVVNTRCEHTPAPSLTYTSKRFWNRKKRFIATNRQRKAKLSQEWKYQNSIHEDSNYFPEPDVDTQTIPIAMKPPPPGSSRQHKPLKLDDEYWTKWECVEQSLSLQSLHDEIENNVRELINSFGYEPKFANPSDKSKLLAKICQSFSVQIQSSDLRSIHCEKDIVEWLYNKERNEMIKKWHRERYMPYNLPTNLIVELPWFYCLANEKSPFKRPMGVKG